MSRKPRYTAEARWIAFMETVSVLMSVNLPDPPTCSHYLDESTARRLRDDLTKALKAMPAMRRHYSKVLGKKVT